MTTSCAQCTAYQCVVSCYVVCYGSNGHLTTDSVDMTEAGTGAGFNILNINVWAHGQLGIGQHAARGVAWWWPCVFLLLGPGITSGSRNTGHFIQLSAQLIRNKVIL